MAMFPRGHGRVVEPLPEASVERLAPGVLRLNHVLLSDTPLFLLDGMPWN